MIGSVVYPHDHGIWLLDIIPEEHLLFFYLILDLLLYGMLNLILLDLVQLHGILNDLLDKSAPVQYLVVHLREE